MSWASTARRCTPIVAAPPQRPASISSSRVQGNAEHLATAACAGGVPAVFLRDAEAAGQWLVENLRPGDVVLVKGSRGVHLERAIEIAQQIEHREAQ